MFKPKRSFGASGHQESDSKQLAKDFCEHLKKTADLRRKSADISLYFIIAYIHFPSKRIAHSLLLINLVNYCFKINNYFVPKICEKWFETMRMLLFFNKWKTSCWPAFIFRHSAKWWMVCHHFVFFFIPRKILGSSMMEPKSVYYIHYSTKFDILLFLANAVI